MEWNIGGIWKILVAAGVAFWVGVAPAIQLLFVLMGIDILTGLLSGRKNGGIRSSIAYLGLRKKTLIIILVYTAAFVEYYAKTQVPILTDYNIPAATAVTLAFCLYEGLSILENVIKGGVPIPPAWFDAVKKGVEKLFGTAPSP